jgi:hypothetical protein
LTNARATGVLGADADRLVDQLSEELDRARGVSGGLRGEARRALIERLASADADLATLARSAVDHAVLQAIEREADAELAGFREQMSAAMVSDARTRTVDRLVRERLGLPTIAFL